MRLWLKEDGHEVPAPSTLAERKVLLRAQPILAVKALAAWGQRPVRLRLDSKKLPTSCTYVLSEVCVTWR